MSYDSQVQWELAGWGAFFDGLADDPEPEDEDGDEDETEYYPSAKEIAEEAWS